MRKCYLTDDARQLGIKRGKEKQIEQARLRREKYDASPNLCKYCSMVVPYEKRKNDYCSRSCSATVNNSGVRRNVVSGTYAKKPCPVCGTETKQRHCSKTCAFAAKRREETELSGILTSHRCGKQYLIDVRGHKCEQCQTETWQSNPVPLVMDHIDGNSDNNELRNVRLLCHNCNALTPTFCGKNKGNGRSRRKNYRNERYSNGESY